MTTNIEEQPSLSKRILRRIFGTPRDIHDTSIFHKLTLILFSHG